MAGIVKQDPKNANRGTVRGDGMLERSLQQYGAGRSALADRNGVLIAGNKAVAKAQELGIPVQLIPSDGKTLYIIQRTDLDLLTDDQAKELAIADNRAGQLNLDWDPDVLQSFIDDGIDLEQFWDDNELAAVLAGMPGDDEWSSAFDALPDGDKSPFQQMTFTVSDEQAEQVNAALAIAKKASPFIDTGNENSNGNALARICETYIMGHRR